VPSAGASSLSVLAYLGAGYSGRAGNASVPAKTRKYILAVRNGLRYVSGRQAARGAISASLREHALATLALCDAFQVTKNPSYRAPAQGAVGYLAARGNPKSGWGDPVATCLAVMAFRSARLSGLAVDPAAKKAVRTWLEAHTDKTRGTVGTSAGIRRDSAAGALIRVLLGEKPKTSPILKLAVDYCAANPPSRAKGRADELDWWFGSLALYRIGGTSWRRWNASMRPIIADARKPDGSWDPAASEVFGTVGTTALEALCLEVYHRYDRVFGVATEEGDAPFTGPRTNSVIGIGGGAGGAFRGRGGRWNLRAYGGGARGFHTESYDQISGYDFRSVADEDSSTFSIDVDTASYSNVRRFLMRENRRPLKDATMEELPNRGNGNYAYIDSLSEARKVLVEQLAGTLLTVARDVKIQVFFNPRRVASWRLIGYENRLLAKQDFNDDTKDAGEIGAGHAVTALYELVPVAEGPPKGRKSDPNPFVVPQQPSVLAEAGALLRLRLRLRYKPPQAQKSVLMERDVFDSGARFDEASADFRWAAAVAGFGMLLRDSKSKGEANWDAVLKLGASALGDDPGGYRASMLAMARKAQALTKSAESATPDDS